MPFFLVLRITTWMFPRKVLRTFDRNALWTFLWKVSGTISANILLMFLRKVLLMFARNALWTFLWKGSGTFSANVLWMFLRTVLSIFLLNVPQEHSENIPLERSKIPDYWFIWKDKYFISSGSVSWKRNILFKTLCETEV